MLRAMGFKHRSLILLLVLLVFDFFFPPKLSPPFFSLPSPFFLVFVLCYSRAVYGFGGSSSAVLPFSIFCLSSNHGQQNSEFRAISPIPPNFFTHIDTHDRWFGNFPAYLWNFSWIFRSVCCKRCPYSSCSWSCSPRGFSHFNFFSSLSAHIFFSQSLDLYHVTSEEVSVTFVKTEHLGISPWQV